MSQFDVSEFLPYLLNRAAEQTSLDFQTHYKRRYGMLRTEWRVLFHLGKHGELTATGIGRLARLHKTRISRAVQALSEKRYLKRTENPDDRRQETLELTRRGRTVFEDLERAAAEYERSITRGMTAAEIASLKAQLLALTAGR